ncbi:hypothetical protein [Paraburkholderia bannensis]|nr:hypothetical protein [Paraburkholderia bannensis]
MLIKSLRMNEPGILAGFRISGRPDAIVASPHLAAQNAWIVGYTGSR